MPESRPPGRTLWRTLRPLRILLGLYLGLVLLMSLLETRLVYPAPRVEWSDWSPAMQPGPIAPRDVWISSHDGVRVHGWFYDRPDAEHAVLYCHGNGEQVADNHSLMQAIRRELNARVLIFDYRGYGKTENARGRRPAPTEAGVLADAVAAHNWLAERTNREPEEVVLIGRSLGGGVAIALAAQQGAKALLLQDTFTRITDVATVHYPWLPARWFMRNRYDSVARLSEYRGPLIVSHGGRDRVVPFSHGERLFELSPSPNKRFLPQPERGHDDPLPKDYWEAARDLLRESP